MAHPTCLHTSVNTLHFKRQILSFESLKNLTLTQAMGYSPLVSAYDAQKRKPVIQLCLLMVGTWFLCKCLLSTESGACRCARLGFRIGSVEGGWLWALHMPLHPHRTVLTCIGPC